ncbi:MAG: spermidine synthase [Betaproteobacteria bacterium]
MSTFGAPTREAASARRPEVPGFAAATFLGAALLFLVEPMVGKTMLPLLGGAPATWNACVFLFQALLLLGYGYAHASTSWLGARGQVLAQLVLLALALALLPFVPPRSSPPLGGGTIGWLLGALVSSLGLPFLVLSTTTPLLQRWYSRAGQPSARDPYFLYALSNAGSLDALLAYPTLVEPTLPLPLQYRLWRIGYAAYAVLVLACAVGVWRAAAGSAPQADPAEPREPASGSSSWAAAGTWVALSAVPASLMLGVTSYLSTDVAAVPLLWVAPLALYLLSLVVAFSRFGAAATRQASRSLPMLALLIGMLLIGRFDAPLALLVPLHLAAFLAASLACHGELARRRPQPAGLTRYYLWLAVGGTLGGAFNALVAPILFSDVSEYPLALVLACALRRASGEADEAPARRGRLALDAAWAVGAGALALAAVLWANRAAPGARLFAAALALPVLVAYAQAASPRRHAAALALMLLAGRFYEGGFGTLVHAERSFFGVYRVQEDRRQGYRFLMQGTTLHGIQSLDPARQAEPLAYYHRSGPFGEAFAALPAASRARVAVVGLGAGALASYARPGQHWVFLEIDPAVERLARDTRYFGYLAGCAERCSVEIGDARRALAATPRRFDLIVLDAFSSDAIPVHLVTREAFSLYRSRLAEGGAILVHFSNRDLSLEPVLGRVAREVALVALVGRDRVFPLSGGGKLSSEWMALAAYRADLGGLAASGRWRAPQVAATTPLWTDDFSNLLGVLRLGRRR